MQNRWSRFLTLALIAVTSIAGHAMTVAERRAQVENRLQQPGLFPSEVAELIVNAADASALDLMPEIARAQVINSEVIQRALQRTTGLEAWFTGQTQRPTNATAIALANLAAQLPKKLAIAVAFSELSLTDESINLILLEGLQSTNVYTELRVSAMARLSLEGVISDEFVKALEKAVLPPVAFLGSDLRLIRSLRTGAVRALSQIPTQASSRALWEISGIDTTAGLHSRPLEDTADVVFMAKAAYKNSLRTRGIRPVPLRERMQRWMTCGLAIAR